MTHSNVKIVYLQTSDCHNKSHVTLGIGPPILVIWAITFLIIGSMWLRLWCV